eukprot:CAMPEP_0172203946 /NCGR_PEP_ID=MMETSP1050-20130122/31609_1 /TAXON_ID=233186 /ORGANISM="Cryptomonas curvata, Strain CCAP979/52" /LENGTH=151 /DNA_ID=CAMNT_0012882303 /DNA_START=197 /DNA_END=649 /DNA_ORIENTATION=-
MKCTNQDSSKGVIGSEFDRDPDVEKLELPSDQAVGGRTMVVTDDHPEFEPDQKSARLHPPLKKHQVQSNIDSVVELGVTSDLVMNQSAPMSFMTSPGLREASDSVAKTGWSSSFLSADASFRRLDSAHQPPHQAQQLAPLETPQPFPRPLP